MFSTRPTAHNLFAFWVIPLLLFIAGVPTSSAGLSSGVIDINHRGINLVGLPLTSSSIDGITLLEPDIAIGNIKRAIDQIYKASSYSAKRIDRLKKQGRVIIVYDAAFPKPKRATQTIAAFFPDFFQHDGQTKEFRVVVGRFGAKWERDGLAAVIVHELVGHGLQHLNGRTFYDRKIDRECEALIYEEKAYQDFGRQRDTSEMVRFRKDMRYKWCSDFTAYMSANNINTDKAWGYGKPDVPSLLKRFGAYIQDLRNSGVAANAVQASKAQQKMKFEQFLNGALERRDPEEMLMIAGRFLKGIGTEKNYASARKWLLRAAQQNHPVAQYHLAAMFESGVGGPENLIDAHVWYSIAAKNGIRKAGERKALLTHKLSRGQLSTALERSAEWQPAHKN